MDSCKVGGVLTETPKICHFGVKYSNSVLNCLSFIIIPLDS